MKTSIYPKHKVNGLLARRDDIPIAERMAELVETVQKTLVRELEALETPQGALFMRRPWSRDAGGGGVACVLEDGRVFEKAGVNFSVVDSPAPAGMLAHMRARQRADILPDKAYSMFVAGVSLVFHPRSPMVPTMHANYRYFEIRDGEDPSKVVASWFGGGCDLTPSVLFDEDARHFHDVIKTVCDAHSTEYYPRFKRWCDEYFYNSHRGEARGVGGIFFDDLEEGDHNELFAFVNDAAAALAAQYVPIVRARMEIPHTDIHKRWQQIRRGRYVEFNLVHDRGTKFGLATPGVRIENVLMSLPLTARWEYDDSPKEEDEHRLVKILKNPIDWV